MGFQVERRGYTKIDNLMQAVYADLIANGFTKVWPEAFTPGTSKSFIVKAGNSVDPLSNTQPWAIKFMWDADAFGTTINSATTGGKLDVVVACPEQFTTSGAHPRYYRRSAGLYYSASYDALGVLGTACGRSNGGGSVQGLAQGFPDRTFIDRTRLTISANNDDTLSAPMSYRLIITDRGVALAVWEQATDQYGNRYSWFVVQRPVDKSTGETIVDGHAPVHCIYGLMYSDPNSPWTDTGNYVIRRFTVREDDVMTPAPTATVTPGGTSDQYGLSLNSDPRPYMGADATRDTQDYRGILNAAQQVAITENNKYVLTYPNGLNTARYAYTHEMDMIAYTSADVVSQGTEVPVRVYDEQEDRKYVALAANGPNNTGMRLMFLSYGGGLPAAS